jgi:hypothetical protein
LGIFGNDAGRTEDIEESESSAWAGFDEIKGENPLSVKPGRNLEKGDSHGLG